MLDLRHLTRLTALAVVAGLIVAACGSSAASPSAAPSSEATAAASIEAPSAAPSEAPASEAAPPASEAALPSFDLSGLMHNVDGVDSYQIAITINGEVSYQATVVNKPVKAESIALGSGTDITKIIHIGDKAWMATGSDSFQEVPTAMIDPLVGSFSPLLLLGAFANGNIGAIAADLGTEQKNGVNAHHFRIDSTTAAGAFAALPAGAAIDLWVSDEGYLVGYALTGDASNTMAIDISHVNDPANVVTAPN